MRNDDAFLEHAIALALANVEQGGRPFGAVVVRNGDIVATGVNRLHATRDPTAHAEINALRKASQALDSADLSDCVVFASGHPCPMCLAAMRMAGIGEVVFAYSNEDAEPFGLSTAAVYADLARPLEQQSMTIRHRAARGVANPYAEWQRRRA